jgi:hypothetical protein
LILYLIAHQRRITGRPPAYAPHPSGLHAAPCPPGLRVSSLAPRWAGVTPCGGLALRRAVLHRDERREVRFRHHIYIYIYREREKRERIRERGKRRGGQIFSKCGGGETTGGWELFFYRVEFRPNINVVTYMSGGILAQYKCENITFVPGGSTNRYKCVAFVLDGLVQTTMSLCERSFVPVGGFKRYKCHHLCWWQKYPIQMKNRARDKCWIL